MEFKISLKRSRKDQLSTKSHVQSDSWLPRSIASLLEENFFSNSYNGTTQKFINSYSKNGLVYMVVNRVASNTSVLPREYQDEKGEPIENSAIEELIKNPNEYQGESEFRQTIYEYLSLSGNSFILHVEGIGAGESLEVLDSANMQILIDSIGDVTGYQYTNNVGKKIKYNTEEILHIKLSNSLSNDREAKYWGLSPLKSLWPVVSASDDLFTARSFIWKNRGVTGILTNRSDTPLLPKERAELQDSFDSEIGGPERTNKVRVSSGDLHHIQLAMSPVDLQLLEGNIDNLRMICAGYEMPSVLFNDMASSTYNNVLEAKKSALTDAYIPLDIKVNEKLSVWLSEILGVKETIVVDISKIESLRLTTNEVAANLNNLPINVAARVMETLSIDEARELIGLDSTTGGEEMLGKQNAKQDENKETE